MTRGCRLTGTEIGRHHGVHARVRTGGTTCSRHTLCGRRLGPGVPTGRLIRNIGWGLIVGPGDLVLCSCPEGWKLLGLRVDLDPVHCPRRHTVGRSLEIK